MRKVRILLLLAIAALTAVLQSCEISSESTCDNVLREHTEGMLWHLRLTCKYQEKCEAKITPLINLGEGPVHPGVCYDRYEYEFDDGKTKETVTMGTTVPVTVDDDDHVRFSLFDSARVEKTYDIDLSEIIHSYTVKDDSVEINVAYFNKVHLYTNGDIVELENMELENGRYSFGFNDGYKSDIYFVKNLNKQSSMNADSIHVYGDLYWR